MEYLLAAVAIIFLIFAFTWMPTLVTGFHDAIVTQQTDVGNITTGMGITAGNITLVEPLYNAALSSVKVLSSSDGGETPILVSYDSTTKSLEVGNLLQSTSRIITATYEYDSTGQFSNARQTFQIGPVMVMLGLICLIILIPAGIAYGLYRRARGG